MKIIQVMLHSAVSNVLKNNFCSKSFQNLGFRTRTHVFEHEAWDPASGTEIQTRSVEFKHRQPISNTHCGIRTDDGAVAFAGKRIAESGARLSGPHPQFTGRQPASRTACCSSARVSVRLRGSGLWIAATYPHGQHLFWKCKSFLLDPARRV